MAADASFCAGQLTSGCPLGSTCSQLEAQAACARLSRHTPGTEAQGAPGPPRRAGVRDRSHPRAPRADGTSPAGTPTVAFSRAVDSAHADGRLRGPSFHGLVIVLALQERFCSPRVLR